MLLIVTVPAYLALLGQEAFGLLNILLLLLVSLEIADLGLGNYFAKIGATIKGSAGDAREMAGRALVAGACVGTLAGVLSGAILAAYGRWGLMLSGADWLDWLGALALYVPSMILSGQVLSLVQLQRGLGAFASLARNQLLFAGLQHAFSLALLCAVSGSLTFAMLGVALGRAVQLWRLCVVMRPLGVKTPMLRAIPWRNFVAWSFAVKIAAALIGLADRLLVAALLGLSANTVFTLAINAVTKFTVFPQVISWVAFPRLAQAGGDGSRRVLRKLAYLQTPLFAGLLLGAAWALEPVFVLWLGPLGVEVAQVGLLLLPGVFFNAMTASYATNLIAQAQPKALALAYGVQLPIFLGLLLWFLEHYGLEGAALAWTLRCGLDLAMLYFLNRWMLKPPSLGG
jgi:O-antigen/teichoic acid export membrane protein